MAQIGKAVAGSTEPIVLTLAIDGVPPNLDGYTVDSIEFTLGDGAKPAVAGTIEAMATQATNTGKVTYTPSAMDLAVGGDVPPLKSEKHYVRVLAYDGDDVPLYFPKGELVDWIDVYRP